MLFCFEFTVAGTGISSISFCLGLLQIYFAGHVCYVISVLCGLFNPGQLLAVFCIYSIYEKLEERGVVHL
jgi:hypothetical protein